ncbi:MAG TPA: ParB/RepB/Spo0J family partition protein [Thermoplasmata archaeon]|nr:ParB/RepB/Spo0J family partition protein [Thermoplasmata archaeon]
MATSEAEVTEQPTTRTESEYTNAPISELERTEGRNIREVDRTTLVDLAASIMQHGILEPVLVTRTPKGLRLVAGFRRVAAAKMLGSKSVPARVLQMDELQVLESQLVENIQRQDLSAIEEAKALKALLEASGLTQEAIGKKIGRSQPYVANRIRLLQLPAAVHKLMDAGSLSASHAEVLSKLPASESKAAADYAGQVVKEGASVTELNRVVSQHVRALEERKKFDEKISKSRFPKCPNCKTAPEREDNPGFVSHGNQYDTNHMWNLSTGETERQRREKDEAKWRKQRDGRLSGTERSTPRPKPVDCRESPLVRSAHDPMAIVAAILKEAGTERIQLLEYDTRGSPGTGGSILRVGIVGRPLGDVHVIARPVPYSSGERTQFVVQDQKASDRKASKSKVQAWERRALAALKLKPGKAAMFDALQLKGTAGTVTARLAKIRTNPELLELARSAEAGGKHRAAVLDYIDEQLLGRGHETYSSIYDRRL